MKWRHLLWIIPTLLIGAIAIDLTRDAGLGLEGPDGERFRYRQRTWVTAITGATCTTIGETIHCRRAPSNYLIAHEWKHTEQQRGRFVPWWIVQYYLGAKDSLEADAHAYGCQHRYDQFWVSRSRLLRSINSSPDAPAEVITCEGVE